MYSAKMFEGARRFYLYIFFISGAAAVLYQVIWQRILTLSLGADSRTIGLIVAAYMLGLGFGSLIGGYLADRLRPFYALVCFAVVECLIGGFALRSKTPLYDWLITLPKHLSFDSDFPFLFAFLILAIPTFLMGSSLPFLVRGLTARMKLASYTVGILYGVNTLGAALGAVLFVGFARYLGFEGSIILGATFNLLCSLIAVALILGTGKDVENERCEPSETDLRTESCARFSTPVLAWAFIYALSGFVAMSFELVWFRILFVIQQANAYTFARLLVLFLCMLGFGAVMGAANSRKIQNPVKLFFQLQIGIGVISALSIALLAMLMGSVQHSTWVYYFALGSEFDELSFNSVVIGLLIPIFLFGPSAYLMGYSFPVLQEIVQEKPEQLGRRVGWLVCGNIVGGVCGALLTSFLLFESLGTSGIIEVLLGLSTVFLVCEGVRARADNATSKAGQTRNGTLAVSAYFLVWMVLPDNHELWKAFHRNYDANYSLREDGSGLFLAVEKEGIAQLHVDGKIHSWLPYAGAHTYLGLLPTIMHPSPEEILIIGLGSGDTVFSAGSSEKTKSLVNVEIVTSQLPLLRDLESSGHYPGLSRLVSDPRVEFIAGDGRAYMRTSQRKFDVIATDPLRPTSAYSGNLYSIEYFELAKSKLKKGGMLCSWSDTPRTIQTFRKVFPFVTLFQNRILIGSEYPINTNFEAILKSERLEEVRDYFEKADMDFDALVKPIVGEPPRALGEIPVGVDVNTDFFPKDELGVAQSQFAF